MSRLLLIALALTLIVAGLAGYSAGLAVRGVVTVTETHTATEVVPLTIRETATLTETVTKVRTITEVIKVAETVTTTLTPTTSPAGVIRVKLGEVARVDDWEVSASEVRSSKYVKHEDSYYEAPEEVVAVIVVVRFKNVGAEVRDLIDFSAPILVTNANKSYERASLWDLRYVFNVTEEVVKSAIKYSEIDLWLKVAPDTYVEGGLLYVIPQGEWPTVLYTTYRPPFKPKVTIAIELSSS